VRRGTNAPLILELVEVRRAEWPPATFFSYDPSGVATVSGAANSFPFLYQGLEHEVTDPARSRGWLRSIGKRRWQ
jgi:hypothetical protein